MAWKGRGRYYNKKEEPDFNFPMNEDKEILGAVNRVNIEEIAAKWVFIAGIDYRNGNMGNFKRMMDAIYAIMSPDLSKEINEWVTEEQERIDDQVRKEYELNKKNALALREHLEIRHYYELWKKLMAEMFKKGWAGVKEVMLDED